MSMNSDPDAELCTVLTRCPLPATPEIDTATRDVLRGSGDGKGFYPCGAYPPPPHGRQLHELAAPAAGARAQAAAAAEPASGLKGAGAD